MSWDCPEGDARQRNVQIAQDENEPRVPDDHVEVPEAGEALLMRRTSLKPNKEVHEPAERKNLFRTMCKSQGKCYKLIIDNGSIGNLVSVDMVEYKVSWLQKGHHWMCHVLLGRQWQYDKNVVYNGRENTFMLEKEGRRHTLIPLKDENVEEKTSPKVLLVKDKEFLK